MRLEGRTALVTGASRGIGAACAKILAREGAFVFVVYKNSREAAEKVVEDIRSRGGSAESVEMDVTNEKQVKNFFDTRKPEIDILVNNAHCSIKPARFERTGLDEFQKHWEHSVGAAVLMSRNAITQMKNRRWGRIVNITSSYIYEGPPGLAHYISAKHALRGLTKAMAVELAKYGITVNSVSPGFTETDMTREYPGFLKDKIAKETPLGRIAVTEDAANAVLFLSLPESGYITGIDLPVSGGSVMN